jgi:uncharacterized protein (DUF2141 family)
VVLGGVLFKSPPIPSSPSGTLVLEIPNLRSTRGQIAILLFQKADGFPKVTDKAVGKWKFPASTTIVLPNITPGKYALTVLHDENKNARMDVNAVGIPQEGYGFSNNPKSKFGAPSFEEAAFTFNGSAATLSIRLTHW